MTRRPALRSLCIALGLLGLVIATAGCGSSGFMLDPYEGAVHIDERPTEVGAVGARLGLRGTDLLFSGPVEQAHYDPDEDLLFVRYREQEGAVPTVVFYDVDAGRPLWSGRGDVRLQIVHERLAVLRGGGETMLVDVETGAVRREAERGIYVLSDGRVLTTAGDLERIDWATGRVLWSRSMPSDHGFRYSVHHGDTLLLVRAGLHAVDLETGDGWHHEASTSSKAIGKAIAKNVLIGLADAVAGTYTPPADAEVTHNLTSLPLRAGGLVYFAARDRLFALDAASGELVWETDLGEEPGDMDLYLPEDGRLVLVGTGFRWVDFERQPAAPPSVRLFDAASGRLDAHFALPAPDRVLDVAFTDGRVALLTESALIQLDDDLGERARVDAVTHYGPFVGLDVVGEALLVRTRDGAWALDAVTLDERYYTHLGGGMSHDRARHRIDGDYLWTAGARGLRRLHIPSGEADVVVPGLGAYAIRGELVVGHEGDRVRLVDLASVRGADPSAATARTPDEEDPR